MADRYYQAAQLKPLISIAGNECEFLECTFTLVTGGKFIGEIAHIAGYKPGSARYDPRMTDSERDANENLMVLCPNHHTIIDADATSYPTAMLHDMKAEHEKHVSQGKTGQVVEGKQLDRIVAEIINEQTNINSGSGTQINNPQYVYNTPQELAEHVKVVKQNMRRYSDRIRIALQRQDAEIGHVQGLLHEIVIAGAYDALESGEDSQFEIAIEELRKISGFCFDESRYNLKRSANDVYLKTVEQIVNSCYEIGAYCIDNRLYPQIKFLVERASFMPGRATSNWLYSLTSTIYRQRKYSEHQVYGNALEYIRKYLGSRIAWTDSESSQYLMQFEYLANIYALCVFDEKRRNFPLHASYYEEDAIYRAIDEIVGDEKTLARAFPGISKQELASNIYILDEWLSQFPGIGLGGFEWTSNLGRFVEKYAPQKQGAK